MNYFLINTPNGTLLFQGMTKAEGHVTWLVPPGESCHWWVPTDSVRQLTLDEARAHLAGEGKGKR